MRLVPVLIMIALTTGCAARNPVPQQRVDDAVGECSDMGYEVATSGYTRCVQKIVAHKDARLDERLAQRLK